MKHLFIPESGRGMRLRVPAGVQIGALILLAWGVSACSALNPREHQDIRLAKDVEVFSCQHLGSTSVTVWAGVGPVTRTSDAVEENLLIEARRQAFRMGGNALVRGASAELGQRAFEVYRCP
ncbi:hypothetical protein AZ34_13010 [Hylemonella gracilis str. Niagara R]|uniref:DUF4156 domain-containing protein n=1 Tax=Hylemonella gracilis str. Niagara R TaxID=1458275 RepID=A0A016XKY8_9BURK|nr:hypothetical protein [Hylemonella gracilis]EYC51888.1 hypothetical protein AZ34_13010 [Hylemonella gracilis str. Niagara R]